MRDTSLIVKKTGVMEQAYGAVWAVIDDGHAVIELSLYVGAFEQAAQAWSRLEDNQDLRHS